MPPAPGAGAASSRPTAGSWPSGRAARAIGPTGGVARAVRDSGRPPGVYWAGRRPILLAERRGPEVEALIDRLEAVVSAYPSAHEYRLWPGPNSNSFIAYVLRRMPELRCALPSVAIGKDWIV